MPKQRYRKGDRVKVLCGHRCWHHKTMGNSFPQSEIISKGLDFVEIDIKPYLKDDVATIDYSYNEMYGNKNAEVSDHKYALRFDKNGWMAWFDENDLING